MIPHSASQLIDVHPPVAAALAAGRPVVGLESTIITHGMPFPQNAEMAGSVEGIVAAEGATPATIAVVDGRLKAVPRGVFAAAAVMQGSRGGVDVPAKDVDRIKSHLAKYYAKLDETPPWES